MIKCRVYSEKYTGNMVTAIRLRAKILKLIFVEEKGYQTKSEVKSVHNGIDNWEITIFYISTYLHTLVTKTYCHQTLST